jgi:hypothetical protein
MKEGAKAVPDQFDALALSPGLMVWSRANTDLPSFVSYRTRRLEP